MNITRTVFALRQGGRCFNYLRSSKSLKIFNSSETLKSANICSARYYSLSDSKTDQREDGAIIKLLKKIPFLQIDSLRSKAAGYMLYENTVDNLNYLQFFEKFGLPDTFYSWFVITELHIWMLSARVMADGSNGQMLRNGMIEALWADTTHRIKKLGEVNPSETRKSTQDLSEQFQAALVAYDETINSDDIILASALWRRLYQKEYASPQHLETLIHYIRKHVSTLDQLNYEQIASVKAVVWEPL